LDGEEQGALLIENRRMRIARAFGEFVFGNIARLWIEFSDVALGICREPDIAVLIADKTMGA